MRNELVQGYLIHHRKYREKSHIVHLFTQEYGRMDGIIRHTPPPQYQPIMLQATGKGDLKNFAKLELLSHPIFLQGDSFFAGFYLNELLLRLCPLEEAMPQTFNQYQKILAQLQLLRSHPQPDLFLRQILRQFEHTFIHELGYAVDFDHDSQQQPILSEQSYQFQTSEGFLPMKSTGAGYLVGASIASMQTYTLGDDFSFEQLQLLGKLYRQMITSLLGERPLKSRQLWMQSTQSRS